MIDFITCGDNISDVCNVLVVCKAKYDTNHSLEQGRFKQCACKKIHVPGVKVLKFFDVNKLKQKDVLLI